MRSSAVPPVSTMPRSTMSDASSGGVRSSTVRIAPTIVVSGSAIPCVISVEVIVMVCVPAGVTGVEQRAVQDAAEAAGARRPAHIVPEPLAAAIGARIPVNVPQGHMVVDIGGGRAEAAVISMYGIVETESVRVAGDRLDDAIAGFVRRRHNVVIGARTAEGSVAPVPGVRARARTVRMA